MLVKTYSPRSFVIVLRLMLVRSLVSDTSTPGMTPPESLIDPRKPPWNPWPNARLAVLSARNAPRTRAARILIVPPPTVSADVTSTKWVDRDEARRNQEATSDDSIWEGF